MPRRFRMRASTIATITAVAAITLGIIDSIQTRAHNRLSVVPYLVIDYSIAAQGDRTLFVVRVSNEGVGPAIIKSMKVKLPPELGGGSHDGWSQAVATLRQRGVEVQTYWEYEGGEAVGVQGEQELMRMALESDSAKARQPAIEKIDIEIVYRSIYHEEFKAKLQ